MANAAQASKKTSNGSVHAVALNNLRVMLLKEDGVWFAQGLDIDYIAQGASLESAQKAFEKGLTLTVREHLKLFGNIKKLLTPAPKETWDEFYELAADGKFHFSAVSAHSLETSCEDSIFVASTRDELQKTKPRSARSKSKTAKKNAQSVLPFNGIAYMQAA